MFIDGFIWLPNVVDKLTFKHNVAQEEAEEIFFNRPQFRYVESGHRHDEDVYVDLGQTNAGRYLIVFFVHKTDNAALILSARDMDQAERRRYERKK